MTTLKEIKGIFKAITKLYGICIINLIDDMTGEIETFNDYEELVNTAPSIEILSVKVKHNVIEIGW